MQREELSPILEKEERSNIQSISKIFGNKFYLKYWLGIFFFSPKAAEKKSVLL